MTMQPKIYIISFLLIWQTYVQTAPVNTVTTTTNVGVTPTGIAITPDGAFAYVANNNN